MPTVTDLGKQGPHPDLIPPLVGTLSQYPFQNNNVGESDIQIVQQRTLYDVTWSRWSRDGIVTKSGTLNVSAGLAVSAPQGGRKQLVGFGAMRLPDRESWGIAQTDAAWIEDPPKLPLTGCFLAMQGSWIGVGGLVYSPDFGRVRMTLADGQAFESTVLGGSFFVLVPCDSAELWSSRMTVTYYATDGREVRMDPYDLGPLDPNDLRRPSSRS